MARSPVASRNPSWGRNEEAVPTLWIGRRRQGSLGRHRLPRMRSPKSPPRAAPTPQKTEESIATTCCSASYRDPTPPIRGQTCIISDPRSWGRNDTTRGPATSIRREVRSAASRGLRDSPHRSPPLEAQKTPRKRRPRPPWGAEFVATERGRAGSSADRRQKTRGVTALPMRARAVASIPVRPMPQ